jgi:hypothetical protein
MRRWHLFLAVGLVSLSLLTYLVDYLLFHDAQHIAIYFIGDLAFVFLEVLLVYLIIEGLLDRKERENRLAKLDTLIAIFFSEAGMGLLGLLFPMDKEGICKEPELVTHVDWKDSDFSEAISRCGALQLDLRPDVEDLLAIHGFLLEKRSELVRVMENSVLMEHDRFTDLLQAILHLSEELGYRDLHKALPPSDLDHLAEDCRRIYRLLLVEWFEHLRHLKENYPHLYSLAVRVNPLSSRPDAVITE